MTKPPAAKRVARTVRVDSQAIVHVSAGAAVSVFWDHPLRRAQRKLRSAELARASARKRAKDSVEHWTNYWLALAHAEHPEYGAQLLAQRARQLAFQGGIEPDPARVVEPDTKRDEISVKRARQFLERERNNPPLEKVRP